LVLTPVTSASVRHAAHALLGAGDIPSLSAIDIDHLRQWVGRERTAVDDLHPFQAQALGHALDLSAPVMAGHVLPPSWQWLYFLDTPAASITGPDGHPKLGEFLPPAPLPRRMWAAGAMQVERPLRLGTPATRRSVIRSVDAKSGKSGSLVFVTLDHEISQSGQLCLREEQNLVYREMPSGAAQLPPGETAPKGADWSRSITPDPVLLFRYSALTYNSHRIHYDRHYAVERDFYPALVVHGPLLATLLLDLVKANLPEASIAAFQFRAVRPTFDTHPFSLHGKRHGNTLKLWSADHEGNVCMSATASLA
jgi:3-methylfumaryl-CoA hydratase